MHYTIQSEEHASQSQLEKDTFHSLDIHNKNIEVMQNDFANID